MTRIFNISGKFPDDVIAALDVLDQHFRQANVRWVLVGALARDAVTSLAQGHKPGRATKDIDLAVAAASMQQFHQHMVGLQRVGLHEHKFTVAGLEIDVIPFGDLAVDGQVEFEDSTLDVSGLSEAADNSDLVRVHENLTVSTASLAALSILKVLAWRDRHFWTNKDAIDLAHLFSATTEAPYGDAIWDDEVAGRLVDYDGATLGAAWLGREAGTLARTGTRRSVLDVLTQDADLLIDDMHDRQARDRLDAYRRGFESTAE